MSSTYTFCADDIQNICDYYKACPLPVCVDEFSIAQLTTGETYRVAIQDYKGNVQTADYTAVAGQIAIDTDDFPEGWFNAYAGQFLIRVYNVNDLTNAVVFTFGSENYSGILVNFKKIVPIPLSAEIQ